MPTQRQVDYQMSMECLVAAGKIVDGFALLTRLTASGLLSHYHQQAFYPMFCMLLKACRSIGDFDGTSQVHASMVRLGLTAPAPLATALDHGRLEGQRLP
eukprot:gnl/TRDRNA2_/TRDRNA2_74751_c0_seq1.p2 gnl/TRDRNA2_/TRDRNA2_74751_c0~~gnl/TRDRNA2_/TRDRNA2_74751_c0_seq1.p2  ORF type:complete len:100 (-),score=15.11 gnl/TRDRNA2_/TRDRNA2_74751_c0_seq1:25-324(-)